MSQNPRGRGCARYVALLATLQSFACGGDLEPAVECRRAGITGGTSRAELLAADPRQERAVCRLDIYDQVEGHVGYCSGTLIGENLVLTANHCVTAGRVEVTFESNGPSPVVLSPERITAHPDRDLALLELPRAAAELDIIPIAVDDEGNLNPGDRVQIAGFGLNAGAGAGMRQFAVTSVQRELTERYFQVHGERRAAACFGDSGGPALVRDRAGKIVVAGVLSSGSSACADADSYERVSTAAGWLFESGLAAPTLSEVLADCSLLGEAGRCFGDGASYCVAGEPFFDACSSAQGCGFDREQRGFRCLTSGTDPCMGVGDRGRCDGATRLSCVEGELAQSPCDACGASCVHSATDGRAICNAGQ